MNIYKSETSITHETIDKFGNNEKTQQNRARSCKTIITYTMTRKSTQSKFSLTRANPLSNELPNHISEALLVAASKYKTFSELCRWGLGRGGGARSLKGRDAWGFSPGRAKSRGRNP